MIYGLGLILMAGFVVWTGFTFFRIFSGWNNPNPPAGRTGSAEGEGMRILYPRRDLNILVKGVPLEPEMVSTSWVAFKPLRKGTFLTAELALLDTEVAPVLALAAQNHLQVTALYAPLLNESPGIQRLRLVGHDAKPRLWDAVKAILAKTGIPSEPDPPTTPVTPPGGTDSFAASVEKVLGNANLSGKVLTFQFNRPEIYKENGIELAPYLGTQSTLSFQWEGKESAVAGEWALTAEEIKPVSETLAQNHITVTNLHSGFTAEFPRLFFLNFWAWGDPHEIVPALSAALGQTHLVLSTQPQKTKGPQPEAEER
jgi:hypothetical protein